MLLSLIIPVYKVELYIEECFESVCSQLTVDLPVEVIIINDGTPDNSMRILENILIKYSHIKDKIKIINKSNGGISSVRNLGIKISNGDYIAFLDSDDFILDGYFTNIINVLVGGDVDVIHFNAKQIDEENNFLEDLNFVDYNGFLNNREEYIRNLFTQAYWYPWLRVIKKEIYKKYSFYEKIYMEDKILYPKLYGAQNIDKIYNLNVSILCYRHRLGSAIRSGFNEELLRGIELGLKEYKPINNKDIYCLVYNQFFLQKLSIMGRKKAGYSEILDFIKNEERNLYFLSFNFKIFLVKYFKNMYICLLLLKSFLAK